MQWKPFLLGPIFKEQGWDNSPFVLQKNKGDYVWLDMPRECAKYDLPWRQPSEFPRRSLLAARVALLGEHQPWMAEFCARVMLANFEHDEDIGNVRALLLDVAKANPRVLAEPVADVAVQALGEHAVALVLRAWVQTIDYNDVRSELFEAIRDVFVREQIALQIPRREIALLADSAPRP